MAYLGIFTNLFCNHQCSYCIQAKSSLDVRKNPDKVDVPQLLAFLKKNRIAHSVKVLGGESSLHPDFEPLMTGLLGLYSKVVFTTNLNGKWYEKFDTALEKMKKWGNKIVWNTSFHPGWMEADVYIERIRKIKAAGLRLNQVSTTDTPDLTKEVADKLMAANIGWALQTFTGRNKEGRMLPQTWADVNTNYPQLYSPAPYIDNYESYLANCEDADENHPPQRDTWVTCKTKRFLIGPDNLIYPCHRHLYVRDHNYAAGSIHDLGMKDFKFKWNRLLGRWNLPCDTKCNPCDFEFVKITDTKKPAVSSAIAV
ncbi:MAG: radical SAM protein [Deltaproteobacteria bacterium]|nr:radical SAM protein [Deltaproteobacteria bacterium]